MNDYDPESFSQYVVATLAEREKRDAEFYSLNPIKEYWLQLSLKDFIGSINHEILREMAGIDAWLKRFINDPSIGSMYISYTYKGEEHKVILKDSFQVMLAEIETMRKILKVIKKYAEIKFDNDSGEEV